MNCALWLNRKKVFSAEEISENLDLASLCGYFTAGSLIEWLKSHNGEEYAAKLSSVSPKDPLLKEKIAEVFGGQPVSYKTFGKGEEYCGLGKEADVVSSGGSSRFGISSSSAGISSAALNSFPFNLGGNIGSFGSAMSNSRFSESFVFSSYSFMSYLLNIGFGSYSLSSGSFGYEWEWEWERIFSKFGSFGFTSFSYGSFAAFMSLWEMKYGSRIFGSYALSYLAALYGSFSGAWGSFPDSGEYDRIMLECLFGCKLNGYGYGIHNI